MLVMPELKLMTVHKKLNRRGTEFIFSFIAVIIIFVSFYSGVIPSS